MVQAGIAVDGVPGERPAPRPAHPRRARGPAGAAGSTASACWRVAAPLAGQAMALAEEIRAALQSKVRGGDGPPSTGAAREAPRCRARAGVPGAAGRRNALHQRVALPQGGKGRIQITTTAIVPTPPSTTAATGPTAAAGEARLELAELVRRADEDRVHGRDAPAHLVRRLELHERLAHDDADHVGRTDDERAPPSRARGWSTGRRRWSRARTRATAVNIRRPALRRSGNHASSSVMPMAPAAGMLRSRPSPHGPDLQDVLARRSAAAPPRRRAARRTDRARSRRERPAASG